MEERGREAAQSIDDTRAESESRMTRESPLDRCEVIVVAYRSRRPLEGLLSALPPELPLIVVDNSADVERLQDLIDRRPNSRYIDGGGNIGFGAACNLGAAAATRPYLVFVNPDCRPTAEALGALATQLDREATVSSCGPGMVNDAGVAQRGGGGWQPTIRRSIVHALALDRFFHNAGIWIKAQPDEALAAEWLAGTCLAIRRDVFLDVGGFDEHYFLYQEDMDLGRRLHSRGFRQVFRGDIRVRHAAGGSSPTERSERRWSLRGGALASYLKAINSPGRALAIRAILGTGFALRGAIFLALRDATRAQEMWTYTRMLRGREASPVSR